MNRRRIEITVSRRRTTLVIRDQSKVDQFEQPACVGEGAHPVRADEAQAAEICPGKIQIKNSGEKELGLIKVDANDSKPN